MRATEQDEGKVRIFFLLKILIILFTYHHHHHLRRVTKDVSHILNEINECKAATDEVNRSKVSLS